MSGRRTRARRRLKVVRDAPSRRTLPFLIISGVLVAPLIFGVVTVQALVSQNAFRLRELSHQTVALQEDYKQLRLEVAELSSPRRISREAKRLGLQLPERVHTIPVQATHDGRSGDTTPSFALKGLVEERP